MLSTHKENPARQRHSIILWELLTHRSIREDERTFARGRSRTEMERLLIGFDEEGGEVTRLARNWGQVQ